MVESEFRDTSFQTNIGTQFDVRLGDLDNQPLKITQFYTRLSKYQQFVLCSVRKWCLAAWGPLGKKIDRLVYGLLKRSNSIDGADRTISPEQVGKELIISIFLVLFSL